jgi:hypothetical protein
MRRHIAPISPTAALAAPHAGQAQTTEAAGVRFANSVLVGDTRLHLNGAGVRHKIVFKAYAAALYLSTSAVTLEAVLAAPGPRHLQIVMLRELDGEELGKPFTRGMKHNAAGEEFAKSIPGFIRMSDIFSARKRPAGRRIVRGGMDTWHPER